MSNHHVYITRKYEDRFQLIGFRTHDDLLRSLPCRQSLFDEHGNVAREWPHGMLLSDCATRESACVLLPENRTRITKAPWPDMLPNNCEMWITT